MLEMTKKEYFSLAIFLGKKTKNAEKGNCPKKFWKKIELIYLISNIYLLDMIPEA